MLGEFSLTKSATKPEKCPICNQKLNKYMECPNICGGWVKIGNYWEWEESEE